MMEAVAAGGLGRGENLLAIVKRTIYENEASPYLKLLKLAGCEYGDFEQMVHHDGVELTLHKLRAEGVYISCEEFKSKKEVIRGGKTFRFRDSDFDNPFIKGHLESRSGATRSSGTRTVYDFDYLTESRAAYRLPLFDAYDALDFPLAMWAPIAPGHGLLSFSCSAPPGDDIRPRRTYSPSVPPAVATAGSRRG